MNNEIKEILDKWKCYIGLTKKFTNNDMELLRVEDIEKVLDYITNLQTELQEANDNITWWSNRFKAVERDNQELKKKLDRRYYKNEYERIKQENERLKENNQNMQEEMARTWQKYDELKQENERLKDIVIEKDSQIKEMIIQKTDYTAVNILEMKLENYKSRCEKAIEYCKSYSCWEDEDETFHESDFCIDDILNILQNGSEEK